jgi:spermidine synthase
MNSEINVKTQTYFGLLLVTLSTLMLEILLTRIFSVTMWYHFAFMAISIAMFGMTVGALLVYLMPGFFSRDKTHYHLALSSFWFSVTAVLGFALHLLVPFSFDVSLKNIVSMTITYLAISVPFIFSGICVCLALTRFPRNVSRLYAADLIGAALGCILFKIVLDITDGPTAIVVVALTAVSGAVVFSYRTNYIKLRNLSVVLCLFLALLASINTYMVWNQSPAFRLKNIKGEGKAAPLYEKWNSFSRIAVENERHSTFAWGLSEVFPREKYPVNQLKITIDATAGTYMTEFDGNLSEMEFLKYDIVNLAHYLRRNAEILVVGFGGGKDILSALAFNQKSVVGVEINQDIIETVNEEFGYFTNLDDISKVRFVNDEARSYIARQDEMYDIIQVSLIDTWAATAAGAFVLTENSLYTIEGWKVLLEKLNPNGILTFSRWYFRDSPAEIFRLAALASSSLMKNGIQNPRDHIAIIRWMQMSEGAVTPLGIGTILVSKEPFSKEDLDILHDITNKLLFEIVIDSRVSRNATLKEIVSGEKLHDIVEKFPLNISPPTDDSPFFFNMLRLRDVFNKDIQEMEISKFNLKAVSVLGVLLIIVIVLTLVFIILPLSLTSNKSVLKGSLPLFVYFAAIGFGFIMVEISQMQKLIVFLGHPTYSLTVVLFSLLISSGLGSYETQRVNEQVQIKPCCIRLVALLGVLFIIGLLMPAVIDLFHDSVTPVRIMVSMALLFPLGFFMGMAFPLGMKMASVNFEQLTPWFWGINGSTSVCGSVLSVIIAIGAGISTSFWSGFACYLVALSAFAWAWHKMERVQQD